eukprot:Awhi_evm3s8010
MSVSTDFKMSTETSIVEKEVKSKKEKKGDQRPTSFIVDDDTFHTSFSSSTSIVFDENNDEDDDEAKLDNQKDHNDAQRNSPNNYVDDNTAPGKVIIADPIDFALIKNRARHRESVYDDVQVITETEYDLPCNLKKMRKDHLERMNSKGVYETPKDYKRVSMNNNKSENEDNYDDDDVNIVIGMVLDDEFYARDNNVHEVIDDVVLDANIPDYLPEPPTTPLATTPTATTPAATSPSSDRRHSADRLKLDVAWNQKNKSAPQLNKFTFEMDLLPGLKKQAKSNCSVDKIFHFPSSADEIVSKYNILTSQVASRSCLDNRISHSGTKWLKDQQRKTSVSVPPSDTSDSEPSDYSLGRGSLRFSTGGQDSSSSSESYRRRAGSETQKRISSPNDLEFKGRKRSESGSEEAIARLKLKKEGHKTPPLSADRPLPIIPTPLQSPQSSPVAISQFFAVYLLGISVFNNVI